jgi:hypothetical protein
MGSLPVTPLCIGRLAGSVFSVRSIALPCVSLPIKFSLPIARQTGYIFGAIGRLNFGLMLHPQNR